MSDGRDLTMLCMFDLPEPALERMRAVAPGLTIHRVGRQDDAYAAHLPAADIIIGWPAVEDLPKARRLRWLQLGSAGADRYIQAVPENVVLTNASGVFGVPIAEHVMAMMLALVRRVPLFVRQADRREWVRGVRCGEISGATCGIVGLGDIGTEVARRAKAFGMRVLAVKRTLTDRPDFVDALWDAAGLDELLAESDHVVLALPGTRHTQHILDAERIGRMKQGACVYNVGRGSAIDQDALIAALQAGRLGGAGLDVTSPEPLPPESPLWAMDNVIISPHCSGSTPHHHERLAEIVLTNLDRLVHDEPLTNVVDRHWEY